MWVWTTTDYLETVELHPWTTYEEDTLPTGLGASISSRDDSLQLPLSQHYLYQRMGIHKMLNKGALLIHRESTRAPYAPSMCASSFKKNPVVSCSTPSLSCPNTADETIPKNANQ
jgi:hypothetical protein